MRVLFTFVNILRYRKLKIDWLHLKRVIAVEVVILSYILAEIRVITLFQPPSWIFLDLWLLASSLSVTDSTIDKFDPENMD